jgi:dihydropyrimidine dehydrogenase (NAD+) subunit PreA
MTRGYGIIGGLMDGLQEYMKRKGFNKISEMVGLSLGKLTQHMDLSREARVASSISKKLCIKCQRCFISCRDAETQAIRINKDKFPLVDRVKCSGCSLCQQVCPVPDCIKMTPFKGARA